MKDQDNHGILNVMGRIASAVMIISVLVFFVFTVMEYNDSPLLFYSDDVMVESAKEKQTKVVLPDSSIVYLNVNSSVVYDKAYNKVSRNIRLYGEAFFNVNPDVEKPFVVQYGDFKTTVMGTSFNLVALNEGISVTVESGTVKVENVVDHIEMTLFSGNHAVYNSWTKAFEKTIVKPQDFFDWHRSNELNLNEVSMDSAFEIIEDWYGVQIHCDSKEILSQNVRVMFVDKSIQEVMNTLQFIVGFEYEIKNDEIYITPLPLD